MSHANCLWKQQLKEQNLFSDFQSRSLWNRQIQKNIPYCYNVIPESKQKHHLNIYIKLYYDDTDLKCCISAGITLRNSWHENYSENNYHHQITWKQLLETAEIDHMYNLDGLKIKFTSRVKNLLYLVHPNFAAFPFIWYF